MSFIAKLRRLRGGRYGNHWLESNGRLVWGRHSYGDGGSPIVHYYPSDSSWTVRIGAFTSIAADVEILPGGNHLIDRVASYPHSDMWGLPAGSRGHSWSKGDVVIGNDVWIGRGARLLGGLSIGDGAIVGAFSVVTKSVAPYTIVAGNPARTIGQRCDNETAALLQAIAWWGWSDDTIREREPELSSTDFKAFILRYSPPDPTLP